MRIPRTKKDEAYRLLRHAEGFYHIFEKRHEEKRAAWLQKIETLRKKYEAEVRKEESG